MCYIPATQNRIRFNGNSKIIARSCVMRIKFYRNSRNAVVLRNNIDNSTLIVSKTTWIAGIKITIT